MPYRTLEYDLSYVERLRQPFGGVAADAAQLGNREERLFGKPASFMLARKLPADGFNLPAQLRPRERHEKSGIAKIGVVFRDFVLEHEVIAERVVGEFGHQPMVLMSITLPMGQNQ